MTEWVEARLRDCFSLATDKVAPDQLASSTRYVGMEHMTPDRPNVDHPGRPAEVTSLVARFQTGDVLFGRLRPYLRKVAIAGDDGVCSPEILVLRPTPNVVPRFLYYLCASDAVIRHTVSRSAGSRMPRASAADIASFQLALPPLHEQQRITAVVSAVDAEFAALTAEAGALHRVVKIRREELVNDESAPELRAEDAFEFSTGVRRTPDRAVGPNMTRYLRSANVGYGSLDLSDVQEMNYDPHEREKFGLQFGDVLVSEGSASAKAVGMPAMWRDDLPGPVCFQMTLLRLRAIRGVCLPEFAFQWCLWAYESGRFLDVAGGTSIKHVSAKRSSQMPVRLPSIERQRAVAAELDSMAHQLDALRAELAALRVMRSDLLTALLSQEITVDAAVDKFVNVV